MSEWVFMTYKKIVDVLLLYQSSTVFVSKFSLE